MYVKFSPRDLNPGPYPLTPHKHLYLWSDHRIKGVRWYVLRVLKLNRSRVKFSISNYLSNRKCWTVPTKNASETATSYAWKVYFKRRMVSKKNDMKEKTQQNEKIWGKLLLVYRKNMSQNLLLFVGDHASLNVKAVLQYYIWERDGEREKHSFGSLSLSFPSMIYWLKLALHFL